MAKATSHHEYLAVDLVRGISAFAMLIWHYQAFYIVSAGRPPIFAHRSEQPLYWLFSAFYNYGQFAVQLFWAISGFVFASAYIERRKTMRQFIVARFARLYPLHFATLLLVAGIQLFSLYRVGGYQVYPTNDFYHFVLNLFFASNWGFEKGFSFNGPIWSVSVEVAIYACFVLSVPLLERFRMLGPSIFIVAFFLLVSHRPSNMFWLCGYYFYIGTLIFFVSQKMGWKCGLLGLALLAVWLIKGYGDADYVSPYADLSLFAGIMLCAAAIDKARAGTRLLGRLAWIGESTYGTYLIHMPVIMITTFIFALTDVNRRAILSHTWFFLAFVSLVFCLARLSYQHIEVPSQIYLKRKWTPGQATRSDMAVTDPLAR